MGRQAANLAFGAVLCALEPKGDETTQHQSNKGDEMHSDEDFGQRFILEAP
jgi:hypothetical protein